MDQMFGADPGSKQGAGVTKRDGLNLGEIDKRAGSHRAKGR